MRYVTDKKLKQPLKRLHQSCHLQPKISLHGSFCNEKMMMMAQKYSKYPRIFTDGGPGPAYLQKKTLIED